AHWRPNVRNFALGLVDDLRPRAMTRDIDWGVPIPIEGWDERDDKRIYVWFDAVVGYLSASVEWAQNRGEPGAWRGWWQNPDSRHAYHLGRVRPAEQRRAARHLGESRQPDAHERIPEFRHGPGARSPRGRRRGGARRRRERLRVGRRAHRGGAVQGRAGRGDSPRFAGQPICEQPGAVGDDQDRPGPSGHGSLRLPPLRRLAEDHADAVPAVHVADPARAPRLRRVPRGSARVSGGDRGGRLDSYRPDRRLQPVGGSLGAERAAAGPAASRAPPALQEARSQAGRGRGAAADGAAGG